MYIITIHTKKEYKLVFREHNLAVHLKRQKYTYSLTQIFYLFLGVHLEEIIMVIPKDFAIRNIYKNEKFETTYISTFG